MSRKLRVVVCGTTFGQMYLEGLRQCRDRFEPVAVLARGSERSQRCAQRYGVKLCTGLDELPGDIDVACVVIRSGLLGGRGAELAMALMERGIHVVQEHPLHHDELAACLRQARAHGVIYQLNPFYVHVEPVRRFIAAARELLRRQQPLYIDAVSGFQLVYSLFDIIGSVLGVLRPWKFSPGPVNEELRRLSATGELPFRTVDGVVAGVPITLRLQNQLNPADPDNHAHLDHRITFGTEGANLSLLNTHGPIVCGRRARYPHEPRDPASRPHFETSALAGDPPGAVLLGPARAPGFLESFERLWPFAIQRALGRLDEAIRTGADPLVLGQYHLTLCLLWQQLTASLGSPELISRELPEPLSAADADALAAAAAGAT
ncbi:Gfo/Idh/MocA family oxidoreductase [Amycolatopsis sp. NPDC004079]|uniref:Gfo/Idh/MocA family oxidoreductase n=1 Tax=Amycolatopsis sp. NPDC004079 TaxID=3154549 RepID=UPI0033B9D3EB